MTRALPLQHRPWRRPCLRGGTMTDGAPPRTAQSIEAVVRQRDEVRQRRAVLAGVGLPPRTPFLRWAFWCPEPRARVEEVLAEITPSGQARVRGRGSYDMDDGRLWPYT